MKIFREYRQDLNFLLPPSLDEFVPEDHEVRIINDVVDALDPSLLLGRYEGGGGLSLSSSNDVKGKSSMHIALEYIAPAELLNRETLPSPQKAF